MAFYHCKSDGYLKVDCSLLKCRICEQSAENIDEIAAHLVSSHNINLDLSITLGVQAFVFKNDQLLCGTCRNNFPCIRQLSRHMGSHIQNHACQSCGKSFSSRTSLQCHKRFAHSDSEIICRKCKKTFGSLEERRAHVTETPRCWPYACSRCSSRFLKWPEKNQHMEMVHNQPQLSYPCPECGECFQKRKPYMYHFRTKHSKEPFICSSCGKVFGNKIHLDRHELIHKRK